jgi:hypothetical protein
MFVRDILMRCHAFGGRYELFMRQCVIVFFLAAGVFYQASAFNGDLNQWNVAKVSTMQNSKSIRIVENDLM